MYLNKSLSILKHSSFVACLMVMSSYETHAAGMGASEFAVPRYQTVDEYGVDTISGQVTASVDTVAIGGDFGLSHSITVRTNSYSLDGNYGYVDRFSGTAKWVKLIDEQTTIEGTVYHPLSVIRVSFLGDTMDFRPVITGDGLNDFYYVAMSDSRHTLEVQANTSLMIWTKPDGSEITFARASASGVSANGGVIKAVYPNGHTIYVHGDVSVTTNTGFQLKYDYIDDNRSLSHNDQPFKYFPPNSTVPADKTLYWSQTNPKYIRGINNAVEYCSRTSRAPCSLSENWPKATFEWPPGMPRAIYIDDTLLSVTDMHGGLTEFHYFSHDLALLDPHDPDSAIIGNFYLVPGLHFSPRLVALKPKDASEITYRYKYKNQYTNAISPGLITKYIPAIKSEVGILTNAKSPLLNNEVGYNYLEPTSIGNPQSKVPLRLSGYRHIATTSTLHPGTLVDVTSPSGYYRFHESFSNRLRQFTDASTGLDTFYEYDQRGNITRLIYEKNQPNESYIEAGYPPSCTPQTRKICNQPLWSKDAKGARTDYTYHAESGQVATITGPAVNGIRPQTRYTYLSKYAYYYKSNGNTLERADTPVYLLVKESTCQMGAAQGAGCENSDDEIITEYDYGPTDTPNNLLLRGKTITANGETRLICYGYDQYGHQVSETLPKAGLTSCYE